jgi:alpha-D-ribose 1-methylphosphonate 5-triphosphate synthase subunit PhnH
LSFGNGRRLTGPGIEKERFLDAGGMPEGFWSAWKANHSKYPLGVDLILSAGRELAALPRTTLVG